MSEFRQLITNGQKKIGFLIGAGAPMSIRTGVTAAKPAGDPLIPDVRILTELVLNKCKAKHKAVIEKLIADIGGAPNIEQILSKVRLLSSAIGNSKVHDYSGDDYRNLANEICAHIGSLVNKTLPEGANPYSKLVSWISGTARAHAVEVFTTNYDLLFEEAFERNNTPYYDGFSGAREPFFDASTISSNGLPVNWTRIWKLHGSLGWELKGDRIVRTGKPDNNTMIFPEQLKYEQIQKLPYTAFFERFKNFLQTPDTLLIACGFSFADAHICSVIDEAMVQNPSVGLMAFHFGKLEDQPSGLRTLATKRPNMSVYAENGAIINCNYGDWKLGDPLNKEWPEIRKTFLEADSGTPKFQLGCFGKLSNFLMNARAERLISVSPAETTSANDAPTEIKKAS